MMRGKTESGFEFEIEEEILDDYEFLELLCEIDGGNVNLTVKMVDRLMGTQEQKKRLKDHVREESGRVSARKLLAEVAEILNSSKEGKNF